MKAHGMHEDTLLDQSKEEHAAMGGLAAVESERKFVQISLQMVFFESPLMRPHQPALNERRDPVYAWQNLVGLFPGAADSGSPMTIFVLCGAWIGRKSVGVNRRARFDMFLNKSLERFSFGVGDNPQATAAKPFGGEQFHCDGHQDLALGTAPALAVPRASEDGFVHFNVPGQHIVSGIADGAPEPMQHRPGRRVRTKPEDPMQRFGGNAIFGGGHVPCCRKPDGQRRSGVVKNCACSRGNSIAARIAPPLAILHAPALGTVTRRAFKAVLPSNPVKVVEAGSIIRKPRHKLGVVARVINPGCGSLALRGSALRFHCAIIELP